MKNLLALAAAAFLIFAGIGWFRGWFHVKSEPGAAGKQHIEIDVDRTKIQDDLKKGKEKVHDLLSDGKDQTNPSKPGTPQAPPTPGTVGITLPPGSFQTSSDGTTITFPGGSLELPPLPLPPPTPSLPPGPGTASLPPSPPPPIEGLPVLPPSGPILPPPK